MIITISGKHGGGKTTIGKKIAESLGIRYLSTGKVFRDLAKHMNMTLIEFIKYVEENPETDEKIHYHGTCRQPQCRKNHPFQRTYRSQTARW